MREPKFRGFSLETKQWHYGHGWFEIDYTDDYLREKGIEPQALLYTGSYPVECELKSMGEFTGLKDKNGREIFEGDIVKYSFKDGGDINTRVLEIFNDGVNFRMKELHRDYWLEKIDGVLKIKHGHLTKYRGETNLLCDVSGLVIYWYEVIGNIYEHPHLLEGDSIENK